MLFVLYHLGLETAMGLLVRAKLSLVLLNTGRKMEWDFSCLHAGVCSTGWERPWLGFAGACWSQEVFGQPAPGAHLLCGHLIPSGMISILGVSTASKWQLFRSVGTGLQSDCQTDWLLFPTGVQEGGLLPERVPCFPGSSLWKSPGFAKEVSGPQSSIHKVFHHKMRGKIVEIATPKKQWQG